jgi:hypothetical protein
MKGKEVLLLIDLSERKKTREGCEYEWWWEKKKKGEYGRV